MTRVKDTVTDASTPANGDVQADLGGPGANIGGPGGNGSDSGGTGAGTTALDAVGTDGNMTSDVASHLKTSGSPRKTTNSNSDQTSKL